MTQFTLAGLRPSFRGPAATLKLISCVLAYKVEVTGNPKHGLAKSVGKSNHKEHLWQVICTEVMIMVRSNVLTVWLVRVCYV